MIRIYILIQSMKSRHWVSRIRFAPAVMKFGPPMIYRTIHDPRTTLLNAYVILSSSRCTLASSSLSSLIAIYMIRDN